MERTMEEHVEIVAELDESADALRIASLEERLADAESAIHALQASAVKVVQASEHGRKTTQTVPVETMAKPGSFAAEASQGSALDLALASLSVEQRIAVKTEMMRSGLLR